MFELQAVTMQRMWDQIQEGREKSQRCRRRRHNSGSFRRRNGVGAHVQQLPQQLMVRTLGEPEDGQRVLLRGWHQ